MEHYGEPATGSPRFMRDVMENKKMAEETVPRLDRTVFSVVDLEKADDDPAYWMSRTPAERLAALEINRRMVYGHHRTTSRLQRLFEVADLD